MVDTLEIEERLKRLDSLYRNSQEDYELLALYSKAAIMELGGWIEEVRDELCHALFSKLYDDPDGSIYKECFSGYNAGFDYETNFRKRAFQVLIGKHGVDEIERHVDQATLDIFKSNLGSLWKRRNEHAHRSISGRTKTIQAPSTTLQQFSHIRKGLIALDGAISQIERIKL